jgi:hypothetical protein
MRMPGEKLIVPALAAGLLAGCGNGDIEDGQVLAYQPPAAACSFEKRLLDPAIENGQACYDFLETGKIAMVGYGIPDKTLQASAKATESEIRRNIKGAGVTVVAIAASSGANEVFEDANPKCVDTKGESFRGSDAVSAETAAMQRWGSFIADAKMPDLKQYGQVIALSDKPSCESTSIQGVASSKGSTRHIDIFTAGMYDSSSKDKLSVPEQVAEASTHELGHNLGLQHGKGIEVISKNYTWVRDQLRDSKSIDLDTVIAEENGQIDDYGDRSYMSGGSDDRRVVAFNAIHQEKLDGLSRAKNPVQEVKVGRKPQHLDLDDRSRYLSVPLVLPINESKLRSYDDEDAAHTYDRLALDTSTWTDSTGTTSDQLNIYLASADGSETILLADTAYWGKAINSCLTIGSTPVKLVVDASGAEVSTDC